MAESEIKVPYVVGCEAKVRRLNGYEHALSAADFAARYQRLVRNLDARSIALIDDIVRRLRLIFAANDGDQLDLYTDDEKKEIQRQRDELVGKTLCLSEELFFWGGCFLPIKNFETSVFFYRYGLDQVKTLASIGNSAIIDAGGYVGDSAWLLSPLTSGRVYVFEPLLENAGRIRQTIAYNALANVELVHAGLGAAKGTMQIHVAGSTGCATLGNKLIEETVRSEDVQIVTLDDFVMTNGIRRIGLIKTDVEGAEQMLLSGAWQVIKRDRPILLISIYHNASDFFDIKPMIEELNLGYEFRIHHPPIKNISGETVLIAEVPQSVKDVKSCSARQDLSAHKSAVLALWHYCTANCRKIDQTKARQIQELRTALEKTRSDRDVLSARLKSKTEQCVASDERLRVFKEAHNAEVARLKEALDRDETRLKSRAEQYMALDERFKAFKEMHNAEVARLKEALDRDETRLKSRAEQYMALDERFKAFKEMHNAEVARLKEASDERLRAYKEAYRSDVAMLRARLAAMDAELAKNKRILRAISKAVG